MYHSYELETLAIVEAIKRFCVYLIGVHFKVITDCSAVRATIAKRDLVLRIAGWWLVLQEYDIEIQYRPAEKMQHVDALSRNPIAVNMVNMSEADWFLTVQLQDEKARRIMIMLEERTADKEIQTNFKAIGGRLYRRTLLGNRL